METVEETQPIRGVYRSRNGWAATFGAERQRVYLGYFSTVEKANAARRKAEARYRQARPGTPTRRDNTSGVPGVSWSERDQRWRAVKRGKYLGSFVEKQDAVAAVRDFEFSNNK